MKSTASTSVLTLQRQERRRCIAYRVQLGSQEQRKPPAAAALVSAVGPVDRPRVRHFGVLDTAETLPVTTPLPSAGAASGPQRHRFAVALSQIAAALGRRLPLPGGLASCGR